MSVSPVDEQDIKSAYRKLVRAFSLQIVPPLPTAFIPRIISGVGLSDDVRQRAFQMAKQVISEEIYVGQSPPGFAAAIVYGAAKESGEAVTQDELASVAYVSIVTISRQWQRVRAELD